MAITFDASTKIIQLDSFAVSEKEIWTAMVDWAIKDDNLKYGVGVTQLGGFEPIALYIYLEQGWTIRPKEADGITTIKGNLLVQGGGSPIAQTVGNYNILVNMETPVKATAIEVISGSGLSDEEHNKLMDLDQATAEVDTEKLTDAIWTADSRTLTQDVGLKDEDLDLLTDKIDEVSDKLNDIPSAVWNFTI